MIRIQSFKGRIVLVPFISTIDTEWSDNSGHKGHYQHQLWSIWMEVHFRLSELSFDNLDIYIIKLNDDIYSKVILQHIM